MERQAVELQEKLAGLLKEAAEVSVALDRLNGTIQGVPHYSVIELRAHELGRQLSREIQQRHMAAVVNHQVGRGTVRRAGPNPNWNPPNDRPARSTGRWTSRNSKDTAGNVGGCFPPAGTAGL